MASSHILHTVDCSAAYNGAGSVIHQLRDPKSGQAGAFFSSAFLYKLNTGMRLDLVAPEAWIHQETDFETNILHELASVIKLSRSDNHKILILSTLHEDHAVAVMDKLRTYSARISADGKTLAPFVNDHMYETLIHHMVMIRREKPVKNRHIWNTVYAHH